MQHEHTQRYVRTQYKQISVHIHAYTRKRAHTHPNTNRHTRERKHSRAKAHTDTRTASDMHARALTHTLTHITSLGHELTNGFRGHKTKALHASGLLPGKPFEASRRQQVRRMQRASRACTCIPRRASHRHAECRGSTCVFLCCISRRLAELQRAGDGHPLA